MGFFSYLCNLKFMILMDTDTYRILAFDCGATSGRAMMGTFTNEEFKMEEVYRFPNPIMEMGGAYYWNVYAIYEHILHCLTELARRGVKLDSIGIDTWGVDFGLLAKDGTLLSLPRAYRDPYTVGIPEKVFATVPREDLYALTGIQTMDFNSIFQLYAQKEAGVSALEHAKCLLFMPDLLSYFLTGRAVCEYTIASTSGMINAYTRQFDKQLLERLGLPTNLLLPMVQPGTVVGTLLPAIAKKTGIGEVPVVAVAGHDTASAVAAVMGAGSHAAYLSSGTWSLMGIVTEAPIVTPRAAELNYTNEGGTEGTTRLLKNITGMWLVEQCRKAWNIAGRDYNYDEMMGLAERAKEYTGRINPDDPRFANPADMDAEIRLALAEGGYAEPKNDAEMLSCIYHSLADRYGEVMGMLRELAPFEIERLHIIGGGSANSLLISWTEEAVGIPVVAGPTEATAIGNLRVQYNSLISRINRNSRNSRKKSD